MVVVTPAIYIGPTTYADFQNETNMLLGAVLRHGAKGQCLKKVLVDGQVCFYPDSGMAEDARGQYTLLPPEQCMSLELDLAALTIA